MVLVRGAGVNHLHPVLAAPLCDGLGVWTFPHESVLEVLEGAEAAALVAAGVSDHAYAVQKLQG